MIIAGSNGILTGSWIYKFFNIIWNWNKEWKKMVLLYLLMQEDMDLDYCKLYIWWSLAKILGIFNI